MESLVKFEDVRKGFDRQKALRPVDVRFEEFNGKPLRIAIVAISGEKVPVVSLSDIAGYTDHDKKNLWRLLNEDMLLKEWSVTVVMTMTDGKNYEVMALTLDGFIGLMVKINPKRVKNIERQERILAFQRWAIPTLRKIMFQERYHLDSDRIPLTAQEMNAIFEMIKYYEKTRSANTYQLLKKTLQKVYPDIVISDSEAMEKVIKQLELSFK
ncbi:MAG: phage antirepressor N-terminal domain-containing protein [Candidatus Jettenia sp. CY-1]|nr:MAG: phage antirepressor N-terminal domain-containing protein [Candidatus Jettenia sp. CY-1]